MNYEMISELAGVFLSREKIGISANDLIKTAKEDVIVWAWCTGMGSDANIYFIKKDGTICHYDHWKNYGYADQVDAFCLMQEMLREQKGDWVQYPCMYDNNLYISRHDKAWVERLCKAPMLRFGGNPYACLECICRELEQTQERG